MATNQVIREDKGPVAIIRVNRPERGNAMTVEMLEAMSSHLQKIDSDPSVHALIITGTGDTFLSGVDVGTVTSRVSEMDPIAWRKFRDLTYSQYRTIYQMKKPTIAAVNGACVVGGFPVALMCDIRIAAESAYFRVGYRRVGLMPSATVCFLLPYLIGMGRAKLLALTDRTISAHEARDWRLVEDVVPSEELMERALDLAMDMASGPPLMIEVTKEAMNLSYGLNWDEIRKQVDYMQFLLGKTEDHVEAINAFAEKRKPSFKGR